MGKTLFTTAILSALMTMPALADGEAGAGSEVEVRDGSLFPELYDHQREALEAERRDAKKRMVASIKEAIENGECPAWASWVSACHETLGAQTRKYFVLVDDDFDASSWRTIGGVAMRLNRATVVDLSYKDFDAGGLDRHHVIQNAHGRYENEGVMLSIRLPFGDMTR